MFKDKKPVGTAPNLKFPLPFASAFPPAVSKPLNVGLPPALRNGSGIEPPTLEAMKNGAEVVARVACAFVPFAGSPLLPNPLESLNQTFPVSASKATPMTAVEPFVIPMLEPVLALILTVPFKSK